MGAEPLLFGLVAAGAAVTLALFARLVWQALALTADRELLALERPAEIEALPPVTVIVPARNEERNIGPCLRSIIAFDYPRLEVIVADDGSTDATGRIVEAIAREAPHGKVRILRPPAPSAEERAAWQSGKSRVLWTAAADVCTPWVLFVDADTRQRPDGLWRAMAFVERHRLDAFSGSGVYRNPSFVGDLLEALLYQVTFLAMPLRKVNDPAARSVAWLNGQFILVRDEAYRAAGGHRAIRRFSFDDMSLGRLLKEREVPFRFLPAASLYECRNYVGLAEAHRGWVRLLAGGTPWLGLGRGFFAGIVSALTVCVLLPLGVLCASASGLIGPYAALGIPLWALAAGQLGIATAVHLLSRAGMHLAAWRAVLLPLAAAMAIAVTLGGYRARYGGKGFDFRGRQLAADEAASWEPQ